MTVSAVVDLLAEAGRLSSGPDAAQLMDWYARRPHGRGSDVEAVLQLRSESGRRSQLVLSAADEMPSLRNIWPAAIWPQREAVERIGVRFTGDPTPTPRRCRNSRAQSGSHGGARALERSRPAADVGLLRYRTGERAVGDPAMAGIRLPER